MSAEVRRLSDPFARYCEFCGRWLATLNDGGESFELAGQAAIQMEAPVLLEDITPGAVVPLRFQPNYVATCLRWRCRLRRWRAEQR